MCIKIMKSKKVIFAKFIMPSLFAISLMGCASFNTKEPKTYSWEDALTYEAEEAQLLNGTKTGSSLKGYSGSGYVEGFADEGDGVSFDINIEEEGFYDFDFISASNGGDYKENYVSVDGESIGTISVESGEFTDSVLKRVYLEAGAHEVTVTKSWGWISLDRLLIKKSDELEQSMYQVKRQLCNKNANEVTRRLYSYMCDIYGKQILSGQYCAGMLGLENTAIHSVTGEYPAVLGLDFIEYTPSRVANGSKGTDTESAIGYWNNGGIVTFCWHWNAPEKYLTKQWYSGFYTEYTNISLEKIMNGEDEEGLELLMRDIDAIAEQLLILQDAGVPVLWRPLHEASGGWFWWGASGPEAYKKLYVLLYEKLTEEYGLNNLIWIWNGQDADWYPGDEYVDIIGWDIYPGEHVYTPQTDTFLKAAACSNEHKMVVLSENGCLFDPDLAFRDGATWGFFCTWEGEFVLKAEGYNRYGEKYTEEYMLKKVYEDERIISRDEIPDLTNYPISE